MTEQSRLSTRRAVVAATVVLCSAALALESVQQGGIDTRAIEFPDTSQYLTLAVDLHTHSVFSDGEVWPSIRVRESILDGLAAFAVTEHLEYQPHLADIPHPDRNRSFRLASNGVPQQQDLIVIPGSEITRRAPYGHMNAVFITDANALLRAESPYEEGNPGDFRRSASEWPAQEVVDAANAQGAFVFWNHSWSNFDDARTVITDFHRDNAAAGKLHGIEVANGSTYSEESFRIALEHDLALIGVSDIHGLIDWSHNPNGGGHRPVTLVLAEEKTAESIREALFARRTVIWFDNLLIGRAPELMPVLEASMDVSASYPGDTSRVLNVRIMNRSDARFQLRHLTDFTMVNDHDLIEVPPHEATTIRVRTGERLPWVTLEFEVLNALTAPDTHPTVRFELNTTAGRTASPTGPGR
jgi:hypothetical protein